MLHESAILESLAVIPESSLSPNPSDWPFTMRKLNRTRRRARPLFLGHKLLDELRILMRLASSVDPRGLVLPETKPVKSF
jgi:hypothetical protein